MSKIKRNSYKSISYLLENFPCVAILGARQVGKSTLLKQLCPKAPFFDLEAREDFQRISRDPGFFLDQFPETIIIDEAQLYPELFPALRVAIDRHRDQPGKFLISGSSSLEHLTQITESLAGRVAIFELGPLNIFEAYETGPSQFISTLKEKKLTLPTKPRFDQKQIDDAFFYGGYPEPFLKRADNQFYSLWMKNYFQTYLNRDIRRLFPGLNFQAFQRFIGMLGASHNQLIKVSDYAGPIDVSEPTAKNYFQIVEGTFLWRNLPSYQKNHKKRLIKMPKGHIRDSGLSHYLAFVKTKQELTHHPKVGLKWESFVIEQILQALNDQLIDYKAFHYRTHNQIEIDLIIEGPWGILPIEIKMGRTIDHKTIKTLDNFIDDYHCPFGILINQADDCCWLNEKVAQIPLKFW